jgi:hypothetical protein
MGKRGLGLWVLVIFILVLAVRASAGPTCMRFLKISTVPRASAMGDAGVALSDATWAEVNPANLTRIDGSLITFSHNAWFQDINLESFSVATASPSQAFGVGVIGLTTDPLEGYDALDVKQGTFRFYDLAVSASYARRLTPVLAVGATGKMLYEKIDWDSATGFAIDLGAGYTPTPTILHGRISLGLAVRDLGPRMGYFDEKFDLPLTFQAGMAYSPIGLPELMDARVVVDYEKTRDRDGGVLVGLEAGLKNVAVLRAGYRDTYDDGDLTFGLGLKLANASIDYAYVNMGEHLGDTHRVSIGLRAGGIFSTPESSR